MSVPMLSYFFILMRTNV